jgi:hypothetical protein
MLVYQHESTKNIKTMIKKNLSDYYPVYKDFSDQNKSRPSEIYSESPFFGNGHSSETVSPVSPPIPNAEELADLALKCGFSTLQTIILLIKNAFEGHVFITYNIRPDQLFSQGTILFQPKPEMTILNFYENIALYEQGLIQVWKVLEKNYPDLPGIRFELLIHNLIVNHIIRFPVSLISSFDIRLFNEMFLMNKQAMQQRVDLTILSERVLGEYEFIDRVNLLYAEKFKEFAQQLRIKEDMFSHYQRKLVLALFPDINTEEELDELMYKRLLDEKLNRTSKNVSKVFPGDPAVSETSFGKLKIREKTKVVYRSVSKNCYEVHTLPDSEISHPELTNIFLEANSIYIEDVTNMAEALLQYMKMLLLLSKVVIFRKSNGLDIPDNFQFLSDVSWKEVVSKDDLKVTRRYLDAKLVAYQMRSLTDYKKKFIMEDDLTDIHKHFLQKQLDFIDHQIVQIQNDIKEVLKLKSQVSVLKPGKN